MTADDTAFHAALDAAPDDWSTRLIFADFLDEAGRRAEAACQRWMAVNEKRALFSDDEALWYDDKIYGLGSYDPLSDLPTYLFEELTGIELVPIGKARYPSRRDAEAALCAALEKVTVTT